jgi:hypothetical protein
MPTNKPMGMKIDPNSYPNGVKTHRVLGTHCHLYSRSLPPSARWGRSICATSLTRVPTLSISFSLSLYVCCGPASSASWTVRPRSLSLAERWASHVSSVFPTIAVDPRPRVRRGDRPRRSRTRPSSFWAPPAPTLSPLPHFTHSRLLSRSTVAACARRRSAATLPTVQPARSRAKSSRALSRGEELAPVRGLSQFCFVLANLASPEFGCAGPPRPRVDLPI